MSRSIALTFVLLALGCDGYHCEGPACPVDAGQDAGVDAGVRRKCFMSCYPRCCDEASGQCSLLSEARCGSDMPWPNDYCVACGPGQLCMPYGSSGRCETRSSRCLTTCPGCCNETTGRCGDGTIEAECGPIGGTCRDCGAGMTCRNRACVVYP